jgi:hypothetical protein
VLVVFGGGAGTLSEVELAVAYGRPVIAFVARRDQLPGLPAEVRSTSALDQVQDFIRAALAPI